jgi:colanic acid biosynthesis glycosyl transferase WcaI
VKILIHGINFSPELTGIGKYSGEMTEWLAAQGHQLRVVTAPPYYPQWRVADGYVNGWGWDKDFELWTEGKSIRTQQGGSLFVYRCPLWVPAKPSGLKRLLHLASFALSSFPVMLRQIFGRPDVVMVIEPSLMSAPVALLVARLCGARAWLHVQDFEVDAAFELGLLKCGRARRLITGVESWLMRRFDRVSTISQKMHQRLLDKGVAPSKACMVVNWVKMTDFALPVPQGIVTYRDELSIPDSAVVALYAGNMGGKQGLEVLAGVVRLCFESGAPIVFVFCGNGPGRADLLARCQGLPNVRFMDLQPVKRLPNLLAMADIHMLPQRAGAADLVMPSKLTGMLASARPVVASAQAGTELATVVQLCGLVVSPGDPLAFANAVQALANDPVLRERLGAAGFEYAQEHLDREAVLGRFEAQLLELVGHWAKQK